MNYTVFAPLRGWYKTYCIGFIWLCVFAPLRGWYKIRKRKGTANQVFVPLRGLYWMMDTVLLR